MWSKHAMSTQRSWSCRSPASIICPKPELHFCVSPNWSQNRAKWQPVAAAVMDWHILAPSNPKAHNQGSQNADYLKRELGQNKKCALCCSIQIEFLLNKTLWLQELCFPFGFLHLYKKTNKHYCFRTGLLWEAGRNNTTVLQYSGWWSWFSDC